MESHHGALPFPDWFHRFLTAGQDHGLPGDYAWTLEVAARRGCARSCRTAPEGMNPLFQEIKDDLMKMVEGYSENYAELPGWFQPMVDAYHVPLKKFGSPRKRQ